MRPHLGGLARKVHTTLDRAMIQGRFAARIFDVLTGRCNRFRAAALPAKSRKK
jgi:hypothetical protein